MSYNITAWKIRSLYLAMPVTFDFMAWVRTLPNRDKHGYENVGQRWLLQESRDELVAIQVNLSAQTWTLELSGSEISGVVENDTLLLKEIDCTSDGSGTIYSDILIPLFEHFKGNLDAIVVWEGGDTINQVNIRDGVVEESEIA